MCAGCSPEIPLTLRNALLLRVAVGEARQQKLGWSGGVCHQCAASDSPDPQPCNHTAHKRGRLEKKHWPDLVMVLVMETSSSSFSSSPGLVCVAAPPSMHLAPGEEEEQEEEESLCVCAGFHRHLEVEDDKVCPMMAMKGHALGRMRMDTRIWERRRKR